MKGKNEKVEWKRWRRERRKKQEEREREKWRGNGKDHERKKAE